MSVCIKDVEPPLLAEHAIQIALDYLDRSGEIDDYAQACDFLIARVGFLIRQGERNKLLIANRAISAFHHYRISRDLAGCSLAERFWATATPEIACC